MSETSITSSESYDSDSSSSLEKSSENSSPQVNIEGLPARRVALSLLDNVISKKQSLDNSIERSDDFLSLSSRDKAFVRMMTATTLRRLGQIDLLLEKALDREGSIRNPILHHILRLGVCQILFMEVPDHATLNTAVRIAQEQGLSGQKGFVNGVLRTITRIGKEWLEKQDPARINTPEWLLKIWIEDYGMRAAGEIANANLAQAPLDITVKNPEKRAFWGNTFKASELSTHSLRLHAAGNVQELEGFEQGEWWVQDASAALPAQLFGPLEGTTVIDLCAAPGGKTMQLAAQGAHVLALDRSSQRLKKLESNVKRMNLESNVTTVIADAGQWKPQDDGAPQRILLDAPCSATGTIRRHPDVLHLKTQSDLERLVTLQERLLHNAANMLGVGGILLYCTCSLQKVEGEYQIEKLLQSRNDFKRVAIQEEEIGNYSDLINENGDLRILPYHLATHGGMDGFYISRLTKI